MVSLNENIAGVWELHPVVERSTLRRSVVNFQGTSCDSAASLRPPLSDVAPTGTKREDCGYYFLPVTQGRCQSLQADFPVFTTAASRCLCGATNELAEKIRAVRTTATASGVRQRVEGASGQRGAT